MDEQRMRHGSVRARRLGAGRRQLSVGIGAAVLGLVFIFSACSDLSEKDYALLDRSLWVIEMIDDGGDYIYWNNPPTAWIRSRPIPEGAVVYRRKLVDDSFVYYYRTGETYFLMGSGDQLIANRNDEERYFMLKDSHNPLIFLGGGTRSGPLVHPDHPFLGVWAEPNGTVSSEVRLVEPAGYTLAIEIESISGFAFVPGWYLFKPVRKGVFETDDAWPEHKMRLESDKEGGWRLTPLVPRPDAKGMVKPVRFVPFIPDEDTGDA